tara:strand:+ start:160 stop:819 length:660 start_codon:yes stop_codon:yes gene_type:complete
MEQPSRLEKLKNYGKKAKDGITQHLVDSTGMSAEFSPIFAAFETGIVGMSDDISINARLIATGLVYGGMGSILSKGRDGWRKMFNVSDSTKERVQAFHDTAYLAAFNVVASPLLYYASGSRDLEEIAFGTACSIGIGSANGTPLGYAIDTFRDLTGIKECERPSYPNFIKRQSSKVKKTIAAGLVAASIGLTVGVYGLTDDTPTYEESSSIEQVIESPN